MQGADKSDLCVAGRFVVGAERVQNAIQSQLTQLIIIILMINNVEISVAFAYAAAVLEVDVLGKRAMNVARYLSRPRETERRSNEHR
jgi:hypothetical protein